MTLDTVRERMAECLRKAGVEAVCAWPGGARRRVQGPVAAVSLRSCQGGPGGFRDYLGERYNQEGLKLLELSCGEVEDDPGTDLLRCPAEAVCEGWLYAVADEAGAFLDFIVRGDGKV